MKARSLTGKIAALPNAIRAQLNRRLRDGQTAPLILPWLNALPPVQKILAGQFAGAPINGQNLCNWRASGYQRWLQEQEPFAKFEKRSRHALKISRAGRHIARGAAVLASDQIFELLETLSKAQLSTADLHKMSTAVTTLLKTDQNFVRLKLDKTRVQQRDEQLFLTRDRDQRDVVAIALRLLKDERAKFVESTPFSHAEKIEILGRHIFGELWEPRFIPPSPEIPVYPENYNPQSTPNQASLNTNQPESSPINPFREKNI